MRRGSCGPYALTIISLVRAMRSMRMAMLNTTHTTAAHSGMPLLNISATDTYVHWNVCVCKDVCVCICVCACAYGSVLGKGVCLY